MKKQFTFIVVLVFLAAAPSTAAIRDIGTVKYVVETSRQLEFEIGAVRVSTAANRAAHVLTMDAERLAVCEKDHHREKIEAGVPAECRDKLQDVRNSVVEVGTEIRASKVRSVNVERYYGMTRAAVVSLRPRHVSTPGIVPRKMECVAEALEFEDHKGGHVGSGYNENSATKAALAACQAFHSRCEIRRCLAVR